MVGENCVVRPNLILGSFSLLAAKASVLFQLVFFTVVEVIKFIKCFEQFSAQDSLVRPSKFLSKIIFILYFVLVMNLSRKKWRANLPSKV